ncbi:sugar phosphate isomerase/epimerase family protein [Streptomyces odontomachi]|uniref:sugar phosphate isomerase/epimerase family protein n=1 Tax=Streptomyces odontomachi TaxID=2944940 RepID=UPI00210E8660|nr:sugar phosphate isomerase/epimerase family protein [Streptomyces sp. ODS25]
MPLDRLDQRFPVDRLAGIGDEAAVGLDGQLAALRRLNWSTVELRTVNGTAVADLTPDAAGTLAERLRAARVRVVCLASRIGNWGRPITGSFDDDVAELETLAQWCTLLGCRYVRIMSYPNDGLAERDWARHAIDRISRLAVRAERCGVTLLHENCAGWAGRSGKRTRRLLDEVGSPALRLLFDIGNGVPHGYDAHRLLEQVLPYVAHVHVKDAVPTAAGTVYTLPGYGRARVMDCLRLLLGSGYAGAFSLEPHLATVPHEGRRAQNGDAAESFVRAGRQLRRLLDTLTRDEQARDALDRSGPTADAPPRAAGPVVAEADT